MHFRLEKLLKFGVVASVLAVSLPFATSISAASLTAGSVLLSDSRPSNAATSYTMQFSGVQTVLTRCIKVQFSTASTAGSKPAGMTITGATFTGSYVPTPASWTATPVDATGVTTITLAAGETPAGATNRTVVLSGITNGSTAGTSYFVQFSTYGNVDCSTSPLDSAVIAYIYTNGQTVSATVDPTLTFAINTVASGAFVNGVSGTTTNVTTQANSIPLGILSSGTNAIAAQDLAVGTNANSGYTVTAKYTGPLASAGHNMTDAAGTNAAPLAFSAVGTEAFGYTTNDGVLGTATTNRFSNAGSYNLYAKFTTLPLEVAYNAGPASETTRIGYQAGISATTAAGSYATTVVYVATPTY